MSLDRATVEAVIADCRERIAKLSAVVELMEREYLGVATPSQAAAIGAAVVREARRSRQARAAKPTKVKAAPPPVVARRGKPGPKPKAVSMSAEPAHQEPASGDAGALRSLRASLGMSQATVGRIAGYQGVSPAGPISLMEAGKQPLPAGLLDKLRQLLRDKKLGDRGKVAS